MRSNKTSCGVMLNLFSSWLVNASTQSDSNVMQIIIYSSIHTRCRRFNRTSWSRRQHPISSPRCVNTVISCSINTLLRRSIWSQMSTRHLLKHIDMNQSWNKLSMCSPKNHHLLRVGVCSKFVSPNLIEYCGTITTLFLETLTIESDFFVLC
jgi:hypothetical protein